MPTKFARAGIFAMAFLAIASGAAFKPASLAATSAGAIPAVAASIEQETIRTIIQHLLQGVRDQIRRKIVGEAPKPETKSEPLRSEPGK